MVSLELFEIVYVLDKNLMRGRFRGKKKEKARALALPLNDKLKIPCKGRMGKLSSEKNNSLEKSCGRRFQRMRGLSVNQKFFNAERAKAQP